LTKTLVICFFAIMFILLGPFLVPITPLAGLHPPEFLADSDSQFIEINGLTVHYKKFGQGEPVFIFLHGFGASLYSWNSVMQPLSMSGTVIVFDRPAFGLTERPLIWKGANPYTPQAQVELVTGLMDSFDIKQAILVGNSAGGTIAMQFALAHKERIKALILVDPAVYNGGGAPSWLRPLFSSAQMHHLGPLVARQLKSRGDEFLNLAWHDPSRIPPLTRDLYKKSFLVENWDKALWELTIVSQPADLQNQIDKLTLPVLVITGDDDRIVPTRESLRLAEELPNASLVVIQQAGHLPHEEQPVVFVDAVNTYVNSLLR
jgi:pimeloyl-ACP methyl ester carboxylesterase